jgi:hypothetical protein
MGSFSVRFSTEIDGHRRMYPHDLKGQEHSVSGADRGAVSELRKTSSRSW